MTYFVRGRIVTPQGILEGLALHLADTRIAAVIPEADVPAGAPRVDLERGLLLPGFIDVQVNGGGGRQFNDDSSVETIRIIGAAHARGGTTGFLPTLTSADYPTIARAVAATDAALADGVPGLIGLHVEGPFISPARHGIHDPSVFRRLDDDGVRLLTSLKRGKLLVTLAPEQATPAQIARLTGAGVIVSLGHSDADYETALKALDAGARGFTHLYNAMSPLATRAPAMVGAALTEDKAWCGIVADGHHVHPAALRIAWACKGPQKLMLVTDAHANAGTDLTRFVMQGKTVTVKDGVCVGPDGTIAGSCLSMADALRNAVRFLGLSLTEASRLAATNAAEFLGLAAERGHIAAGARADLVLLDEQMRVRTVWIGGRQRDAGQD